jgi:signal transduction histidine kinase
MYARMNDLRATEPVPSSDRGRETDLLLAIAEVASRVVKAPRFGVGLDETLGILGRAAGFARVYIFENAGVDGAEVAHSPSQWAAPGYLDFRTVPGAYPVAYSLFSDWLVEDLRQGRPTKFGLVQHGAQRNEQLGSLDVYAMEMPARILAVPIHVGGRWWGALSFDCLEATQRFSETDLAALQSLAATFSAVLEREQAEAARLTAGRERAALLAAINRAALGLLSGSDFDEAMDRALAELGEGLGIGRAAVGVIGPPDETSGLGTLTWHWEWVSEGVGRTIDDPKLRTIPLDQQRDIYEKALANEIILIEDHGLREGFEADQAYQEALSARSTFVVPIFDGGTLWGAISGDDVVAPRRWSEAEIGAIRLMAAAIGGAVGKAREQAARLAAERERAQVAERAAADLARRRDLLEAVVASSDDFLRATTLAEGAGKVLERIGKAMDVDRIGIGWFEWSPDRSKVLRYHFNLEWTTAGIPRQSDDPELSSIAMSNYGEFLRPLLRAEPVAMVTEDLADPVARAEQEATGALSQFQHPIMVDGELWGTIGADDCTRPRRFDEAEIATLRLLASAIGSLIKRERLTQARLDAERELAEEKSRMAREIHDTLAQGFTGVIMQLHATEDALDVGDARDAARHTARALDRARMGLSEARRSVYALRPPMLDEGDVVGALKVMVTRIFEGLPVKERLQVLGEPGALAEPVAVELFRIAQEGLNNAIRHARASRVEVTLDFTAPEGVTLTIVDDGVGFDQHRPANPHGFGLVSMRERAERLGASLLIRSNPVSGGTRLMVSVGREVDALASSSLANPPDAPRLDDPRMDFAE